MDPSWGDGVGYQTDDGESVPYIAIGDFGESRVISSDGDELDRRNRGTELLKPPEMLELEKQARVSDKEHNRLRKVGTNQSADVWSLGCLLFELLTGRFLFQDFDWPAFYTRVTGKAGHQEVIDEPNRRLLEGHTHLLELINQMLQ